MLERLTAYLDSIRARDPAPRSRAEILLYPGVWALALPPHRALAVRGRALFPRPAGQPLSPLADRDRHPSGRQDREELLHRPRLHRDRRDRRDRRQRDDLPVRHAGRHQPDQRQGRQAPPDAQRQRHHRLGRAGHRPDHGRRPRAHRRQCGGDRRRARRRDDDRPQGPLDAGPGRNLAARVHSLRHPVRRAVRAFGRRASSHRAIDHAARGSRAGSRPRAELAALRDRAAEPVEPVTRKRSAER